MGHHELLHVKLKDESLYGEHQCDEDQYDGPQCDVVLYDELLLYAQELCDVQ